VRRGRFSFQDLRPPAPPEALRARVLLAARSAKTAEAASVIDRIWESRRARLAVAAVFLALLALQFGIRTPVVKRSYRSLLRWGASDDGISLPDSRLGAAEQWKELAPELGLSHEGRRMGGGVGG
jgi:hypothetical protein